MTTYAPNFTARYRLRYSVGNARHSLTLRMIGNPATVYDGMIVKIEDVFDAIAGIMYTDWRLEDAEFAEQGSDTFVPAEAPNIPAGTVSTVGRTVANSAVYLTIGGKSTLNNSTKMFIYGTNLNPFSLSQANNYRIDQTETPWAIQLMNQLNLLRAEGWAAADAQPVAYVRKYFNVGISAYRQGQIRKGL